MKKYWELEELENEVFLRRPFWIFKSAILNFFFFCFISGKNPALLYEVTFSSALWMVFPESWKRSFAFFYAHDCTCNENRKHRSDKHATEQVSCEVSSNFEGIYFLASMNACIYFPCLSYIFEVKSSESETYLTFR